MLFSIIVPVYNVEVYLPRCLDSILNQTYEEFECIVVDDGSHDSSGNICDEYANRDSRIKVIHQQNAGPGSARNKGLAIASGEYICFCDSDDWIEKDLLCELSKTIENKNPDIVIYGFAHVLIKEKNFNIYHKDEIKRIKDNVLTDEWTCAAWNKCFRKSFLDGKQFPVGVLYEDAAFIPQLVYQAEKIEVIEKYFYNYDLRIEGSITKIQKSNRVYDLVLAWVSNVDFAKKNKLISERVCFLKLLITAYDCLLLDCKDNLLNEEQKQYIHIIVSAFDNKDNLIKNELSKKDLRLEYKALHNRLRYYIAKKDLIKIATSFCDYSVVKLKYFLC